MSLRMKDFKWTHANDNDESPFIKSGLKQTGFTTESLQYVESKFTPV